MNCAVHPNRQAMHLCVRCGSWYCASCYNAAANQCISCSKDRAASSMGTNPAHVSGTILQSVHLWRPLIHTALSLSALSFGLLTFFIHPVFWIPLGVSLVAHIPIFFLGNSVAPAKTIINTKAKNITEAQITTLLKTSNRLTVQRLAATTGSSEEAAAERLRQLAIDGVLESGTDDTDLIFYLPDAPPALRGD